MTGLYEILHIKSGRAYIGSSVDIDRRLKAHRNLLRRGACDNIRLQRAWNRDGPSAFRFRPLRPTALGTMRDEEADEIAARGELVYNTSTVVRRGARANNCALSDNAVREIRTVAATGLSVADIACRFSIPRWTAQRVIMGETYLHVTGGVPCRGPLVARGERCGAGKLTADQVLAIRALLEQGHSGVSVARRYNVTPHNVYLIASRKIWRHI